MKINLQFIFFLLLLSIFSYCLQKGDSTIPKESSKSNPRLFDIKSKPDLTLKTKKDEGYSSPIKSRNRATNTLETSKNEDEIKMTITNEDNNFRRYIGQNGSISFITDYYDYDDIFNSSNI